MSRSRRDRRGRRPSGKKCPESANGGCSWCGTGDQKRFHRIRARRLGHRIAQQAQRSRDTD